MTTRIALTAAAAACLAACASTPVERGQMTSSQLALGDTQQTYARATEEERNRVVCRREVQTGSNRPVRICTTLAQRNRIQADSEAAMRLLEGRMTPYETINNPAGGQ